MVKDTQNNLYFFIISFSKKKKSTQVAAKNRRPTQKKTTAWHVGILMVFFLTRCLVRFYDQKNAFHAD